MSIGLEFGELQPPPPRPSPTPSAPLQRRCFTALSDSIAARSATGFKGQAASGLGEAIGAWFDTAARTLNHSPSRATRRALAVTSRRSTRSTTASRSRSSPTARRTASAVAPE